MTGIGVFLVKLRALNGVHSGWDGCILALITRQGSNGQYHL